MSEDEARAYAREVGSRMLALFDRDLLGAWVGGSLALGGYAPGRSDVDIAAVVSRELSEDEKRTAVERLRHEALPCPARKLELVVYRRGLPPPAFELNLNTGASELHASFSAGEEPGFWFVLDVAIVRLVGTPLVGPSPAELLPEPPREQLLAALRQSLVWALEWAPPDDLVLNAARAWRFAEQGVWSSKPDAGAWVLERAKRPVIVQEALSLRLGRPGARVERPEAEAFARTVLGRLVS